MNSATAGTINNTVALNNPAAIAQQYSLVVEAFKHRKM